MRNTNLRQPNCVWSSQKEKCAKLRSSAKEILSKKRVITSCYTCRIKKLQAGFLLRGRMWLLYECHPDLGLALLSLTSFIRYSATSPDFLRLDETRIGRKILNKVLTKFINTLLSGQRTLSKRNMRFAIHFICTNRLKQIIWYLLWQKRGIEYSVCHVFCVF